MQWFGFIPNSSSKAIHCKADFMCQGVSTLLKQNREPEYYSQTLPFQIFFNLSNTGMRINNRENLENRFLTCVSASAYTLTTSSVPEGLTKERACLYFFTKLSMASCRPAGVTARLSASVVSITLRSATYTKKEKEKRSPSGATISNWLEVDTDTLLCAGL